MSMQTPRIWKKGSETLNFKTSSIGLKFMLTRNNKGMQRAVLLEMGQEDHLVSGLRVQMMLDFVFYFPAKHQNIPYSNN